MGFGHIMVADSVVNTGFEHEFHEILGLFVRYAGVKTALELGVCAGKGAKTLLKAVGKDGQVWGIDIERRPSIQEIEREWPKWTFICQDDLTVDWNREIDLLFIDSSHVQEHCLTELRKFSPFVRHWIILHDTIITGVTEAIKIFLSENKNQWIWAEWLHRHGLALLMRKDL